MIQRTLFFLIVLVYTIDSRVWSSPNPLLEGFKNPPASAKPKTWMHSMSGNMSRPGLRKDLQAIADAGLGGVLLFHVSHFIPKGSVIFNTDEHLELVGHAAAECERLGLSFGVHNCDGWTSSGGPWVTPEQSMKMLVWSESIVDGSDRVDFILPQPTAREGYYEDIATIAYPAFIEEVENARLKPRVTASHSDFDTTLVVDGRWDKHSVLPSSKEGEGWIQFSYEEVKEIQSIHVALTKTIAGSREVHLLTSMDGKRFEKQHSFHLKRLGKREFAVEESFIPLKAKHFRLAIHDDFEIQEVSLSSWKRFDDFLARSSLLKIEDEELRFLDAQSEGFVIDPTEVVNLTSQVDSEGRLTASLPPGKWTILRFGMTSTAAVNSPASAEGGGLEVDKMSKKSLEIHYNAFVRNVIDVTKSVAPNALQYIQIDSFEVGGQNWTQGYEGVFEETYGYDLIPYLPLYTGRLVGSASESDAVLWQVRKQNSNLVTENYFGHFAKLVHEDGLIAYTEPYSFNGPFSELDAGKYADRTMGEFWMHQRYQTETAVSSARIYGKPIISAEAFSAQKDINWRGHPGMLKLTGDKAWALGINEFMFHRFAHQANTHVLPGMTMSLWGSHIDRTQTWWESAGKPWFKYIARGSYLLRQGLPSSDMLVFVGEGDPNSAVEADKLGESKHWQVNFDSINSDALLHRLSANEQLLELPEGTRYKFLQLRNAHRMSLEVLRKVDQLSGAGCTIVGNAPELIADPFPSESERKEFSDLVDRIWSRPATYQSLDIAKIYKEQGFEFDMTLLGDGEIQYIHRTLPDQDLYFFSNHSGAPKRYECSFEALDRSVELWYPMSGDVVRTAEYAQRGSRTNVTVNLDPNESVFVVLRKDLEKRNPVVGIESEANGRRDVSFGDTDSLVFRGSENGRYDLHRENGIQHTIDLKGIPEALPIFGTWKVAFEDPFGEEFTTTLDSLVDWSEIEDMRIKHFSGSAEYTTTFSMSSGELIAGIVPLLSLGEVGVVAEVRLNGHDLGAAWIAPFEFDLSSLLVVGQNELSIRVSNTWTNRLIGDESLERTDGYQMGKSRQMPDWYVNNEPLPKGGRKTFTTYDFYQEDDPLESSGLIGPVQIRFEKLVRVGE